MFFDKLIAKLKIGKRKSSENDADGDALSTAAETALTADEAEALRLSGGLLVETDETSPTADETPPAATKDDAYYAALLEAAEKSSGFDDPKPAESGVTPAKSNLDDEILKMIQADEEAGENFAVRGSALSDDSVPAEDEAEGVLPAVAVAARKKKKVKKTKKSLKAIIRDMRMPQMILIAGVLVFLILCTVAVAIWLPPVIMADQAEKNELAHYLPVTVPVNVPNSENFVLINAIDTLNGEPLTLKRISMGQMATLFYFNRYFDTEAYEIVLYDQSGTLLHRYKHDYENVPGQNTVLKFSALGSDAQLLTLAIQHIETREVAEFDFRLEEPPDFAQPLYVNTPIQLTGDSDGMELTVTHAVFSNTGTDIYYTLRGVPGTNVTGGWQQESSARFTMRDGTHMVLPQSQQPAEYLFAAQQMVLGKMTFAPVRNLNKPIELIFRDLFRDYPIPPDTQIDLLSLYVRRAQQDLQIMPVEEHSVIFDRLTKQGDYAVLTLHGINAAGVRMETWIEVDLIAETPDGALSIPGECIPGYDSTNVNFNVFTYREQLSGLPISQYRLALKRLRLRVPKESVTVSLAAHAAPPDEARETAEQAVREAFMTRLAYKSQHIALQEITGFSEALLDDRALMRAYTPVLTAEPPQYSVQVIAGILQGDDELLAVVEEEWIAGFGGEPIGHQHTHQVVATQKAGQWIIVSDVIIE